MIVAVAPSTTPSMPIHNPVKQTLVITNERLPLHLLFPTAVLRTLTDKNSPIRHHSIKLKNFIDGFESSGSTECLYADLVCVHSELLNEIKINKKKLKKKTGSEVAPRKKTHTRTNKSVPV
jgi:hypothetical protein